MKRLESNLPFHILDPTPTDSLAPEYPFAWTGIYPLEAGRYELCLADGPAPVMSLVVVADHGIGDSSLQGVAKWCVQRFAAPAESVLPGQEIPIGKHVSLQLQASGRKSFFLQIDAKVRLGLYTQFTAEAFQLQLKNADGASARLVDSPRARRALPHSVLAPPPPRAPMSRRKGAIIPVESERDWG